MGKHPWITSGGDAPLTYKTSKKGRLMETIYLHGSSDVKDAGSKIQSASREMTSAASSIEDSLQRFRMFLDEWLVRFEEAVNKMQTGID